MAVQLDWQEFEGKLYCTHNGITYQIVTQNNNPYFYATLNIAVPSRETGIWTSVASRQRVGSTSTADRDQKEVLQAVKDYAAFLAGLPLVINGAPKLPH